jgi:hypothetical protein
MAATLRATPPPGLALADSGLRYSADPVTGDDADDADDDLDDLGVGPGASRALRSIGEAVEHVRLRIDAQIAAAADAAAEPRVALGGDRAVRVAFYTLLPPPQQRALFLEVMGNVEAWPRVRPLFGAPPYDFLEPGDARRFAAGGFAAGRSNMAHDEVRTVASYSQFGAGQFRDAYGREYKIARIGRALPSAGDPLLFDPAALRTGSGPLLMHVRVRRTTRRKRIEALADVTRRRTVLFPTPGEELRLQLVPAMRTALGAAEGEGGGDGSGATLVVRAERVVPRGRSANTAAMLATIT